MSTHHLPNLSWPTLGLALACMLPASGQTILAGEPEREELPLPRAGVNASDIRRAASNRSVRDIPSQFSELIERQASTRELLEALVLQGQMARLPAAPQLPWSTWQYPGWRWELPLSATQRLILASDRGMLVAIRHTSTRQGTRVEMSATDLLATSPLRGRSRLGSSSNHAHASAASVEHLARKAPTLFPWYYYFAGPTAEVVSSLGLPPPPIDLLR